MAKQAKTLKQGTAVMYGEFPGTIVRHYSGGMYEVRLPGGVGCVDAADLRIVGAR